MLPNQEFSSSLNHYKTDLSHLFEDYPPIPEAKQKNKQTKKRAYIGQNKKVRLPEQKLCFKKFTITWVNAFVVMLRGDKAG